MSRASHAADQITQLPADIESGIGKHIVPKQTSQACVKVLRNAMRELETICSGPAVCERANDMNECVREALADKSLCVAWAQEKSAEGAGKEQGKRGVNVCDLVDISELASVSKIPLYNSSQVRWCVCVCV